MLNELGQEKVALEQLNEAFVLYREIIVEDGLRGITLRRIDNNVILLTGYHGNFGRYDQALQVQAEHIEVLRVVAALDPASTAAREALARRCMLMARYAARYERFSISAKACEDCLEIFRELNGREVGKGSYTREIERVVREQDRLKTAASEN